MSQNTIGPNSILAQLNAAAARTPSVSNDEFQALMKRLQGSDHTKALQHAMRWLKKNKKKLAEGDSENSIDSLLKSIEEELDEDER